MPDMNMIEAIRDAVDVKMSQIRMFSFLARTLAILAGCFARRPAYKKRTACTAVSIRQFQKAASWA